MKFFSERATEFFSIDGWA